MLVSSLQPLLNRGAWSQLAPGPNHGTCGGLRLGTRGQEHSTDLPNFQEQEEGHANLQEAPERTCCEHHRWVEGGGGSTAGHPSPSQPQGDTHQHPENGARKMAAAVKQMLALSKGWCLAQDGVMEGLFPACTGGKK